MRARPGDDGRGEAAKPVSVADGALQPPDGTHGSPSSEAARRERLVDEQRHAAALIRGAAASIHAPARLRAWLAAQGRDQAVPPSTRLTTRRRPR
jgi:hypothetical protein